MSIKVKEIKDDAIIDIKVNKAFYLMTKNLLYTLFLQIQEFENSEELIKEVAEKPYAELNELQKGFHTLTLLLAEIERQATENNMFEEKEIDPKSMTD